MSKNVYAIGLTAIACLFAAGLKIALAQNVPPRQVPAGKASGPGKFIQTFTVKLRGGEKIVPGDEKLFSKFDMVMLTRT